MAVPTQYLFEGNAFDRMRAAEELLDPGTQRILGDLDLPAGARCLEVGAGGGSIARWLCERVGSTGRVLATDLDTQFLEATPLPNLTIRRHDIVSDPLEEDSFDLVHARLVLEHLAEPEAVLGKLARALRPGGWLVVEDHDYISAAPVSAHGAAQHRRTHTARMRMFADAGVDHFFGRKLPALLSELGLTDLGNDGRTWIFEGGSPAARWLRLSMQHLRPRLVANTELTDADIDEMLTLFDDPAWTALSPIFLAAWGRRP